MEDVSAVHPTFSAEKKLEIIRRNCLREQIQQGKCCMQTYTSV